MLGADEEPLSPRYEDMYRRGSVPSAPLTIRSLSRLFAVRAGDVGLEAGGATRWALRSNPSSGNLHPTEGYLLIGALPGLATRPACTTTRRASTVSSGARTAPPSAFARADARVSAAGLSRRPLVDPLARGVEVRRARVPLLPARRRAMRSARFASPPRPWAGARSLLHGLADETIEDLLGLNRAEDFAGAEREQPDTRLAVWPNDPADRGVQARSASIALTASIRCGARADAARLVRPANRLSRDDPVAWERHRRSGSSPHASRSPRR